MKIKANVNILNSLRVFSHVSHNLYANDYETFKYVDTQFLQEAEPQKNKPSHVSWYTQRVKSESQVSGLTGHK